MIKNLFSGFAIVSLLSLLALFAFWRFECKAYLVDYVLQRLDFDWISAALSTETLVLRAQSIILCNEWPRMANVNGNFSFVVTCGSDVYL